MVQVTRVIEIEAKCDRFIDMGGMSAHVDTEVKRIESEYMTCDDIEHAVREACMALNGMRTMRDAMLMGGTSYEIRNVRISDWKMTNVRGMYEKDFAQRWAAANGDEATIRIRLRWVQDKPYIFPRIFVNGDWFADYIGNEYVNDMEVEGRLLISLTRVGE